MFRGTLYARRGVLAALLIATVGLAGCSKSIDGKYVMQGGMAAVEFKGGKAILTSQGLGTTETETADYKQEGDKITVKSKMGDMVFTLTKEGTSRECSARSKRLPAERIRCGAFL